MQNFLMAGTAMQSFYGNLFLIVAAAAFIRGFIRAWNGK